MGCPVHLSLFSLEIPESGPGFWTAWGRSLTGPMCTLPYLYHTAAGFLKIRYPSPPQASCLTRRSCLTREGILQTQAQGFWQLCPSSSWNASKRQTGVRSHLWKNNNLHSFSICFFGFRCGPGILQWLVRITDMLLNWICFSITYSCKGQIYHFKAESDAWLKWGTRERSAVNI